MNNETDILEELRESYRKLGPVRKVIRTQFGIAAGNTRKKAVSEWPETYKEVASLYEHLRISAADNISEEKTAEWWQNIIKQAAQELQKQGIQPGEITGQLVKDFPLSERSIQRYLPADFKRPYTKSDSVSESGNGTVEHGPDFQPYRKGLSETASAHRVATNTPSENKLQSLLSYIPGLDADYKYYEPIDREFRCPQCGIGRSDKEGVCGRCNSPLKQSSYHPDAVVDHWLVLEVEGAGSASADNEERDAYLTSKGKTIVHIPNDCVAKYPAVIKQFVEVLHSKVKA